MQVLLNADTVHPELPAAMVFATPIYKAAYSSVLTAFFDILPQHALAGKSVLPLATGGSAHHMLAVDYT